MTDDLRNRHDDVVWRLRFQELYEPPRCCWMKALTVNNRWRGCAIWSRRSSAWRITADALAPLLASVNDPEHLTQIGEWIILCTSGEELLNRVRTP